jgi:hypothetical protein
VNCSKGGAGIFRQGRGEKSSGPAPRGALLTNPHHSVRPALQGRDEERALPVRTRNGQVKRRKGNGKIEARLPAVAGWRGRKKEAWRGEPLADFAASFQRYSLLQLTFSFRLRRLLRRAGYSPSGRGKEGLSFLPEFCPALLSLSGPLKINSLRGHARPRERLPIPARSGQPGPPHPYRFAERREREGWRVPRLVYPPS